MLVCARENILTNIGEYHVGPLEPASKSWRAVLTFVAIGLLYLAVARVCLFFVYTSEGVASIWPPSGLALAVLLLTARRHWPAAISVLFIANTCANLLGSNSLPVSLAFALVNCAETLLIAGLLHRFSQAPFDFQRLSQALGFFFFILAGNALTALLGAATAVLSFGVDFWRVWLTWWIADSLGMFLVAPLILAWRPGFVGPRHWRLARVVEGVALFVCLSFVVGYLFLDAQPHRVDSILRTYLLFPFLIWAGLRYDLRFVTILLAYTTLLAFVGELNGLGQFSDPNQSPDQRLWAVQVYLVVLIFTTLVLSATVKQLKQTGARLSRSEDEYRNLFQDASIGIFHSLPGAGFIRVNNSLAAMLGYASPEEMLAAVTDIAGQLYVDSPSYQGVLEQTIKQDGWSYAVNRYRRKDGSLMTGRLSLRKVLSAEGGLVYLEGFVEDISERQVADDIGQARLRLLKFADQHSLDELLVATLDEAEALTGSQIGFYHFLEADQTTLILQNWSTRTKQEYCKAQGKGAHYPVDQAGVWVDCIRERGPVIHNDYASLTQRKGLPDGHAALTRELVVPVLRGENIVSILGVGNKPQDYTQLDVTIVAQLADLAWEITGSKRATEALKQSETLLSASQALARVGGWEYDLDSKKMTWTHEVYRIYGVAPDFDPNNIPQDLSFYAPEDQKLIETAFQSAINAGQAYDLELGFVNAQGQNLWVRTQGNPLIENGKVVRVTGTLMDITASKLAEERLNRLKYKLEQQLAENEELRAMLVEQSTHDALTGLYNRRYLDDALQREILRAEREGYPVSVLMLDIDRFKSFNDNYGHAAGDQVLTALGSLLRVNIRESDIACRYGGEEFVVILPRADTADAWKLAEHFREDFSGVRIGQEGLSATISVGLAVYPQHSLSVIGILRAADSALYAAKTGGRNCVRVAE